MRSLLVEELSFGYTDRGTLEGVSFDLNEGEALAIVGPNGAGKSTLLKCLNRILPRASGNITVFGKGLDAFTQRELAKHVGYVPQPDGKPAPFTALEFALLGRYPHLSPFSGATSADRALVMEHLSRVGVAEFAERSMAELSGGERQRVMIAAALAQEAKLLLLDEPTTFLDYRHRQEVFDLLLSLHRERGLGLVWVTHDISQALSLGGRVLALRDGKTQFHGSPREFVVSGAMERLFETRFSLVPSPTDGIPVFVPPEDLH